MDISDLSWLLAASPILIFLIIMLGFKWGGSQASMLSWLFTGTIAWIFFGADFKLFGYTYVKAFLLSIDVLLIIWNALFLYYLTEQAGTIQQISLWLSGLTNNRAKQGIFLGWLFPSFLQGIGGFGVPVAVAAPLLVSTGFTPIQALVMASIGHAWGVTFGSMASSFQSLIAVSGLSGLALAPATATLFSIMVLISGLIVTWIADGFKGLKSTFPFTITLGILLGGGQYLLATKGLWIISITVPALAALLVSFLWMRLSHRNSLLAGEQIYSKEIAIAIFPYVILVGLTLILNLILPIRNLLGSFTISLNFPEISTSLGDITPAENGRNIAYLNHPGEIIFLSSLFTYIFYRVRGLLKKGDVQLILKRTMLNSVDTALTIFAMVGITTIMSHTRMTNILAEGISRSVQQILFPLASPFIGALGSIITGSNTNSNVLFAQLQMRTAELLNLSVPLVLAAQTAGGAFGSIMAPAKVVLGCTTVGLVNQEGKVIGKILAYGFSLVLMVGILIMLMIFLD